MERIILILLSHSLGECYLTTILIVALLCFTHHSCTYRHAASGTLPFRHRATFVQSLSFVATSGCPSPSAHFLQIFALCFRDDYLRATSRSWTCVVVNFDRFVSTAIFATAVFVVRPPSSAISISSWRGSPSPAQVDKLPPRYVLCEIRYVS